MCILHNQRDATYTTFFIIIIGALHVSGWIFRPSSGACKTVGVALGIVIGLEQESMTIPKAAHTVL